MYYHIIRINVRGYYLFFFKKKYSQKSTLTFYPRHVERHQGCQIKALDLNIRLVRLNHILISFEMLRGILYTNNCGYYNKGGSYYPAVTITDNTVFCPSWSVLMWFFRFPEVVKDFPQESHLWFLCPSWSIFMCLFRFPNVVDDFSHESHL